LHSVCDQQTPQIFQLARDHLQGRDFDGFHAERAEHLGMFANNLGGAPDLGLEFDRRNRLNSILRL
jgi:hypothetical protein